MSNFRRTSKNRPLYILSENQTWLKIRNKKEYYKSLSISELRGLIISQKMMLNMEARDQRSRQRLQSTISKLIKALASKTSESRKKESLR